MRRARHLLEGWMPRLGAIHHRCVVSSGVSVLLTRREVYLLAVLIGVVTYVAIIVQLWSSPAVRMHLSMSSMRPRQHSAVEVDCGCQSEHKSISESEIKKELESFAHKHRGGESE